MVDNTDDRERDGWPDNTPLRELVEESLESAFAAERLSINTVFETLTNPGRRYVLTYLAQADGYVTVTELVDYVLEISDASMTDEQFRKNVLLALRQDHLPALAESGFVQYNRERQLVSPTETTPLVVPYVKLALAQQQRATEMKEREDERPTSR